MCFLPDYVGTKRGEGEYILTELCASLCKLAANGKASERVESDKTDLLA